MSKYALKRNNSCNFQGKIKLHNIRVETFEGQTPEQLLINQMNGFFISSLFSETEIASEFSQIGPWINQKQESKSYFVQKKKKALTPVPKLEKFKSLKSAYRLNTEYISMNNFITNQQHPTVSSLHLFTDTYLSKQQSFIENNLHSNTAFTSSTVYFQKLSDKLIFQQPIQKKKKANYLLKMPYFELKQQKHTQFRKILKVNKGILSSFNIRNKTN